MRWSWFALLTLVSTSPVCASEADNRIGATGQEGRLDLIQAIRRTEKAEHLLAEANLRYSAARSGQHNKGSGPMSLLNPGSRKRWRDAVAATEAEQRVSEERLLMAKANYESVRLQVCAANPSIPECGEKLN